MFDMSRLTKNLIFFALGLLLPFLILFLPMRSHAEVLALGDINQSTVGTYLSSGAIEILSTASCQANTLQYAPEYQAPMGIFDSNGCYAGAARWRFYGWVDCASGAATCDVPAEHLPAPPEPPTWSNGVQDPDEDGRDCGGVTGVDCVESCWPEQNLVDGKCETKRTIAPDSSGDCPSNYFPVIEGGETLYCDEIIAPTEPFLAADSWEPPEGESSDIPPPPSNPWNEQTKTTDTTIAASTVTDPDGTVHNIGTTSTVETDSEGNSRTVEKVVDTATAPDGSKTITTTINTTNNGAGSSDSTTTSITNVQTFDADGNLVAESNAESGTEADPDKDKDLPVDVSTEVETAEIDFEPLVDALGVVAGRFPFNLPNSMLQYYALLDVDPVAPSYTLELYGKDFTVNLSIFDDVASVIRFLIGSLITLGFMYYIIHFYRGIS